MNEASLVSAIATFALKLASLLIVEEITPEEATELVWID